jgi:hypothetical protein
VLYVVQDYGATNAEIIEISKKSMFGKLRFFTAVVTVLGLLNPEGGSINFTRSIRYYLRTTWRNVPKAPKLQKLICLHKKATFLYLAYA